jgi:hypothetical protein
VADFTQAAHSLAVIMTDRIFLQQCQYEGGSLGHFRFLAVCCEASLHCGAGARERDFGISVAFMITREAWRNYRALWKRLRNDLRRSLRGLRIISSGVPISAMMPSFMNPTRLDTSAANAIS